jgi:uncharacterized protein Veg
MQRSSFNVGDLVKIRTSFSRKKIGKMAIIVERYCLWNATIFIIDTGEKEEFDVRKLEAVKKCP